MNNFFKNLWNSDSSKEKESAVIQRPAHSKYSPEIEQIHHEFEVAHEVLLEEAKKHIGIAEAHPVDKVKRMVALGFAQAKQVDETSGIIKQADLSQEQMDIVLEYKRKYPLNKFITEEQVKVICEKYNLVCGEIGKFRGFL